MPAQKADPPGILASIESVLDDPTDDLPEEAMLTCAERILGVMEAIGNIPKDDYNDAQKFHYRGVERVVAVTRDAMIRYRLLCVPKSVSPYTETSERANANGKAQWWRVATLRIVYEFINADDEEDTLEVEVVAEANDLGDKAVSKAMTAAHKSVLLQTFQIGDSGTDQDTGADEAPEREWLDQEAVTILRAAIGALAAPSQKVLRAAWRSSWGSVSRGEVPLDAVEEVWALLGALAEAEFAATVRDDEVAAK